MPKISVIVPVYNTEQYLSRCIDSILAQTYTDFELLLIDDGSTDSSGAICDEYAQKDSRIKVFHIKNGGANNARLKGIQESHGLYIMFVDSDDTISYNYISAFYDEISQTSASVVVRTENANKDKVNKLEYMADMCIGCISVQLVDKIMSKDILLSAFKPLPRDLPLGEDFMQNMFIAEKSLFVKYFKNNEICYNYTENLASVSHTINSTCSYEKYFYGILDNMLEIKEEIRQALFLSKINGLVKVVLSGNEIDYNDEYFLSCKEEFKKWYKPLDGFIIFYIPNKYICKKLLVVKRLISTFCRRVKSKFLK